MRVELMFPSKYLKAADILVSGKNEVTVEIEKVYMDTLQTRDGKSEKKPVMSFQKTEKLLVLNKTNAMAIAELLGPETEEWTGKKINLCAARVSAFGKEVDAIRIRKAPMNARVSAALDQQVA